MKTTNKKQCPECDSKEIFDTGNREPNGGDVSPEDRYSYARRPIYGCKKCDTLFCINQPTT